LQNHPKYFPKLKNGAINVYLYPKTGAKIFETQQKIIFEVIKRSISHLTSSIIPSSLSSDYAFPQGLLLRVITVRFGLILHFLIFLSGQVPFSH